MCVTGPYRYRLVVVALLVAIAFFRAAAAGRGIAGGKGGFFARCGTAWGRLLLFDQFGFLLSLQFGCFTANQLNRSRQCLCAGAKARTDFGGRLSHRLAARQATHEGGYGLGRA